MADNKPAEAQRILHKLAQEHEGITLLHSALAKRKPRAARRTIAGDVQACRCLFRATYR